jgi:hypothetical protein
MKQNIRIPQYSIYLYVYFVIKKRLPSIEPCVDQYPQLKELYTNMIITPVSLQNITDHLRICETTGIRNHKLEQIMYDHMKNNKPLDNTIQQAFAGYIRMFFKENWDPYKNIINNYPIVREMYNTIIGLQHRKIR